MKDQWKYEFSLTGSLHDRDSNAGIVKPTKEHRYYNHLVSAFGDLLQTNLYAFESRFGGIARAGGVSQTYNHAVITSLDTGRPLVEIFNISVKAKDPHHFRAPGLHLRFEDGIAAFEKELGLSLSALASTKKQTANLASYYHTNGLTLVANPGLIELSSILHQHRAYHQLEPYFISLRGPATDPFNYYNSHFRYNSLREGFVALLQLDLQRLMLEQYAGPVSGHPINTASLVHEFTDLVLLGKVDRRPEGVVLPGAYLMFPTGNQDIARHAGIDLSGFSNNQIGSNHYVKIGSLSEDGTSLQAFTTFDALRESLTMGGEAPYFIQFRHEGDWGVGKGSAAPSPMPFQSIKTAMLYLTDIPKEVLDEPLADGRKVRFIEIIERDSDKVVAQLFKQQEHYGNIFPGYYLKANPAYILPHLKELAPLLTTIAEDRQLHFLLTSIASGATLRKNTGRPPRQPPPARPKCNSR